MDEQEKTDLDKAKAEVQIIQLRTFDYMKYLASMSESALVQAGHRKGNAQAVLDTMQRALLDINKVWKSYLKKYPDE